MLQRPLGPDERSETDDEYLLIRQYFLSILIDKKTKTLRAFIMLKW